MQIKTFPSDAHKQNNSEWKIKTTGHSYILLIEKNHGSPVHVSKIGWLSVLKIDKQMKKETKAADTLKYVECNMRSTNAFSEGKKKIHVSFNNELNSAE